MYLALMKIGFANVLLTVARSVTGSDVLDCSRLSRLWYGVVYEPIEVSNCFVLGTMIKHHLPNRAAPIRAFAFGEGGMSTRTSP